jgi:hypothetical protein
MTEPLVLAESESEPRSYGILSDSLEEIDVNDLFMCHEMTADQWGKALPLPKKA